MRPQTKSQVPIGTILSGRYRVSREIGRGGMATVYEAEHIEIGKRVAVKILDPSLARNDTVIERFNREARAAASVESPHICEVFDIGRLDDGRPYMVLELLEGESLYERMVRDGPLKILDTVCIISQVGRGLARAHAAGIVHRDLKPENIFLHRNVEGEEVVKIVDFGLAKLHAPVSEAQERLTREGAIFGTPLYMSPEQVSGQGQADHRSDLWALGCIAYECLTGQPIWPVDRGMAYIFAQIVTQPIPIPSSQRSDLPRAFDVWFNRALQREPAARYQSAQEMVVDMATALGHDASGLVSAPMILPYFPADRSPVVVDGAGAGRSVVMTDSRPVAPTAGQDDALASTEPPPVSEHGPTEVPPEPLLPPLPPSSSAKPKSRLTAFVLAGVAAVFVAGLVVTVGWLALESPDVGPAGSAPSATASQAETSAVAQSVASAMAAGAESPMPHWAASIRKSQQLIAKSRAPAAVALLERAVERSDHPALLTMLDQARIASAATGPCSVRAFGRPRPYDAERPARSATVSSTVDGALVAWTAGEMGATHAYAVRLDSELQPVSDAIDVTPEAQHVVGLRLAQAGDQAGLLFVETAGGQRGAWLQTLLPTGSPAGKAKRIASHPGRTSQPSVVPGPKGFWIAYGDRASGQVFDLYLRRFAEGELTEPLRLTAHGWPDAGDERDAASPRVDFAGEQLMVAYVRQTLRENDVVVHRAGSMEELLERRPRLTPSDDGETDATVVTETKLKVHGPSMGCDDATCFVGWRNQPSGSHIAAVDVVTGEVVWRKTFASAGTDVGVATHPQGGALMVWFDRGRVRSAPLSREGMGSVSVLARVHGEQAPPSLVPYRLAGQWLTSWTCFEGGRPEVFVARLSCEGI